MTTQLYFDGIGYVNNRGMSKYWGVTFSTDKETGMFAQWRVKAGVLDGTQIHLNSIFELTEEEAAKIAASYYEYPLSKNYPINRTIPISKGWEFRITADRTIHKIACADNPTPFNQTMSATGAATPRKGRVLQSQYPSAKLPTSWSIKSIQALRELVDVVATDDSIDDDYEQMVSRIMKARRK